MLSQAEIEKARNVAGAAAGSHVWTEYGYFIVRDGAVSPRRVGPYAAKAHGDFNRLVTPPFVLRLLDEIERLHAVLRMLESRRKTVDTHGRGG